MIIDINMHILPEGIFDDEALLEAFLRALRKPTANTPTEHLPIRPEADSHREAARYENLNSVTLCGCQSRSIMDKAGWTRHSLDTLWQGADARSVPAGQRQHAK